MLNFLKRIPVYIKIYPNKIELTNIKTDETISRSAPSDFSSARLIVAEFNIAETLIRDILNEMTLSKRTLKVLIQQMDNFEEPLSESEKRILRDLAEQAGAAVVYIVNRKHALSKDEGRDFLQGVQNLRFVTN